MQNITIQIENERGGLLQRLSINFALILGHIIQRDGFSDEFPWLSSIDPYGDTVFNLLQIPHLVSELESFGRVSNGDVQKNIAEFINEINILKDKEHLYLRFIGD